MPNLPRPYPLHLMPDGYAEWYPTPVSWPELRRGTIIRRGDYLIDAGDAARGFIGYRTGYMETRVVRPWPRLRLDSEGVAEVVGELPDGWLTLGDDAVPQPFDVLVYEGGALVMLEPQWPSREALSTVALACQFRFNSRSEGYGRVVAVCRHPFIDELPYVNAVRGAANWADQLNAMFVDAEPEQPGARRRINFKSTNAIPLPLP